MKAANRGNSDKRHPLYAEFQALPAPIREAVCNDFKCFVFVKEHGNYDAMVRSVYERLIREKSRPLFQQWSHAAAAMRNRRCTSQAELDEVIEYWLSMPRTYGYHVEDSLIQFLQIFTPSQIKGAMYVATAKGRNNYFKYLCGILHNWLEDLANGKQPPFFKVD